LHGPDPAAGARPATADGPSQSRRAFFASVKGVRKGARVGAPRFRSKWDARQTIRFTANARWKITEAGRLLLPKIGEVKVRWSRSLPGSRGFPPDPVPRSGTATDEKAGILGLQPEEQIKNP
jgi:hypothetical protein